MPEDAHSGILVTTTLDSPVYSLWLTISKIYGPKILGGEANVDPAVSAVGSVQ